ncbi:glycerophosphodiester phosphodiesterase family protein [Roseospirillum parvum]|uniref:Glycerophosphoryl diester phosphodiesterase n=1 Tax=Roseospirillum parvum TaxID=83401 RepID=A0A1G8BKE8_9PROT|nr:glycerophosphodiester phosphodiesterase family protein [Roseospirillum parvum]SDH33707.1 glycerophosphoryl diester phosphodiesterase [Roseospirillum parvum]
MLLPPLVGHRGVAAVAPENTLAGLKAAARLGVPAVEVDVKLTADSRPVLFHDETLERTTDGLGDLAATPLEVLAGFSAGLNFSREMARETVPTLEEALDLILDLGLGLDLEVKPCPGRAEETARVALAVAAGLWPAEVAPPVISSFTAPCLAVAREVVPDWPRALLVERADADARAAAGELGCAGLFVEQRGLDAATVATAREAGLSVAAYTVNAPERAAELLGFGVDSLISDAPHLLGIAPGA